MHGTRIVMNKCTKWLIVLLWCYTVVVDLVRCMCLALFGAGLMILWWNTTMKIKNTCLACIDHEPSLKIKYNGSTLILERIYWKRKEER